MRPADSLLPRPALTSPSLLAATVSSLSHRAASRQDLWRLLTDSYTVDLDAVDPRAVRRAEILDGRPGGSVDYRNIDWTATYGGFVDGKTVDLQTAPTPSVVNFQMQQTTPFKVLVRVLNEGGTAAQNLNDPLVVVHFDLMNYVDGQWTGDLRYGPAPPGTTGGIAYVGGRVGAKYRVCANGIDGGFGTACGEITLADVYFAVEDENVFRMHKTDPHSRCPVAAQLGQILSAPLRAAECALHSSLAKTSIRDVSSAIV